MVVSHYNTDTGYFWNLPSVMLTLDKTISEFEERIRKLAYQVQDPFDNPFISTSIISVILNNPLYSEILSFSRLCSFKTDEYIGSIIEKVCFHVAETLGEDLSRNDAPFSSLNRLKEILDNVDVDPSVTPYILFKVVEKLKADKIPFSLLTLDPVRLWFLFNDLKANMRDEAWEYVILRALNDISEDIFGIREVFSNYAVSVKSAIKEEYGNQHWYVGIVKSHVAISDVLRRRGILCPFTYVANRFFRETREVVKDILTNSPRDALIKYDSNLWVDETVNSYSLIQIESEMSRIPVCVKLQD